MFERGLEEIMAVAKVFESGVFMRYRGGENGFTRQFEQNITTDMRIAHALCMNSGTNALIAAAVGLKLGHGDEVIVPAYTWVATAMAPLMAGAVPVLANIDDTLGLDPADVERKITPQTRAIIVAHLNNRLCDMDRIMAIAARHRLMVIEDACQAVGLNYADGRYAGTIGNAGVFSFNVYKNIMCGEGGMLLTADQTVYERALMFHDAGCYTRDHASEIREPFFPGFNFRVSEIQGAILSAQYRRLPRIKARLAEHKAIALDALSRSSQFSIVPENDPGTLSVALRFADKEQAVDFARKSGCGRLGDSGRHIFTNWVPILNHSYYDERLNPYNFAARPIEYPATAFQQTLDILDSTVLLNYGYDMERRDYGEFCRKLTEL